MRCGCGPDPLEMLSKLMLIGFSVVSRVAIWHFCVPIRDLALALDRYMNL